MNSEKKYVVTERQLLDLLCYQMECVMNERDGVDNWGWYGSSYEEVVRDYYPEDLPEDEHPDFYECARARLEAGEFEEQVDIQELFGNFLVDESMN